MRPVTVIHLLNEILQPEHKTTIVDVSVYIRMQKCPLSGEFGA